MVSCRLSAVKRETKTEKDRDNERDRDRESQTEREGGNICMVGEVFLQYC